MEKEYGGYLPIELNNGKEYYCGLDVMAFNCARSAIAYIVKKNDYKKIYIPFYMCESVRDRLFDYDIEIQYYHINELMRPEIESIEDFAVIMIPNYFGVSNHDRDMMNQYKHIILDNTQAFFQEPIMGQNIYNIYSCRKFIGVCDGAYLVGSNVKKEDLRPYEPQFAGYMFDSITYGTNKMYEMSLKNEEQLEKSDIYGMSQLSQRILAGADYQEIIAKRRRNFLCIHEQLGDINELPVDLGESCVPMVYPFLCKNEYLRKNLIDNKIYVPQWWKYILEESGANEYEKYLCKYLLPLPIDQRYGIDDMKQIIHIIKTNM